MTYVPKWDDPHAYIVEGSGEFPVDMLRKEFAYPANGPSAAALLRKGKRKVMLVAAHGARHCAPRRWESFGWQVVDGFANGFPMPLGWEKEAA